MDTPIVTSTGAFQSAAELHVAIERAAREATTLKTRLSSIDQERLNALPRLDHDALDAIDAETIKVRRGIERLDLVLPELQRVHAQRLAAEREDARHGALRTALDTRSDAAARLDEVLAQLGPAFENYQRATQAVQQAAAPIQPGINVEGSQHDRQIMAAISLHAADFVTAAGIKLPIFNEPQPMAVSVDAIRHHFHWLWPSPAKEA